jgi:peptidyl-prolyl cis-trans isomerase SurA
MNMLVLLNFTNNRFIRPSQAFRSREGWGLCCLAQPRGEGFSDGMAILPAGGYMRFWKKLSMFFVCMIFFTVVSSGDARSEVVDRIVATVNGEIILYSEIQEQLKVMEKIQPDLKSLEPEKKAMVEREILNQLIRQRLTEAEVKRMKITITNSEVDQAIETIMQEHHFASKAQFENALKQDGQTLEKLRESVKKELERNRLLERVLKMKTVITDQQVDAYLKGDNPDLLAAQQKIHLGVILLPVDEKSNNAKDVEKTGRDIVEKLKGGADFKRLATEFSKGPAVGEGGDIGFMAPEELAPQVSEAIKNLKGGEVSGLVRGQGGYYILKVFEIDRGEKLNKSDPAVREKIRTQLYQKELDRKFDEWVRNLESKAFIQNTL